MLFPDEPLADNTQTLILRDDLSTTVSENESELSVSTFCFNQELRSPAKDTFYLGNIKSNKYKKGMNQSQVWGITNTQRKVLKELEDKYEKDDIMTRSATVAYLWLFDFPFYWINSRVKICERVRDSYVFFDVNNVNYHHWQSNL